MAVVAGCTYWTGRRLARPRVVIVIADDAAGADGIFRPRTDPDHSGSSSAFMTEGNLNTPHPKNVCAASGPATALRFLGQSLAPLEVAANSSAGCEPADFHLYVVTRVRGPGADSCCIEGLNPRLRRDSGRRSYRSHRGKLPIGKNDRHASQHL
jgi:hypothetical protein